MNMKQLKYILVLAYEGSFSKAAGVLNISQPSLSQYVKKIEQQVGIELFDRTNGEVRLTDAGKIYVEVGRKILDLEHQMEVSFSDISDHKKGSLIIGTSPYRAAGMLPEITRQFREVYPGMHLNICEGTTSELAEGMEHGHYDMCLTLLPINERIFSYEKIIEEEVVLAVPYSYPEFESKMLSTRKYPVINVKHLDQKHFIMLTDTQFMQKQLRDLEADYNINLNTAAIVKSLEAQIEMVKAGIGFALMPSGIKRFCKKNEVRFYSFEQEFCKRDVVVMWRKEQKLPEVAKTLINIIKNISW